MPTPITAYECNYCKKKVYKARNSAASHEKKCPWRVENHACATCDNRVVDSVDCGPSHILTVYRCSIYGTDLGVTTNLQIHCPGWIEKRGEPCLPELAEESDCQYQ